MDNVVFHIFIAAPPGFPKEIETPGYFLQVVDTPFFLWLFRGLMLAALIACLIYACTKPPAEENTPQSQCESENREAKK